MKCKILKKLFPRIIFIKVSSKSPEREDSLAAAAVEKTKQNHCLDVATYEAPGEAHLIDKKQMLPELILLPELTLCNFNIVL
jgi:hypothetical protein